MFWAPDELEGVIIDRLRQLRVENPGVLYYIPDKLLADAELVNEARPEDEFQGPMRAFEPYKKAYDELGALLAAHAKGQGVRSGLGRTPENALYQKATELHLGSVPLWNGLQASWVSWGKR